ARLLVGQYSDRGAAFPGQGAALVDHPRRSLAQRGLDYTQGDLVRISAGAVGLPLAVAVANSRPLNLMFYPVLIALQSVPKVALAPMILVWLGTGLESRLAIVWLVAFFPIIVDTAAGLRATPKELLELAHSLNASPLQVFLKVQLPAALPFVVTGAKVAITLAVIGAVIGEFVGSSEGLGFLLLSATSQL